MDRQSVVNSRLLSNFMDNEFIGTKEEVAIKRKRWITLDYATGYDIGYIFTSGSFGEGFEMPGSDFDTMAIAKNVIILDPTHQPDIPRQRSNQTVFYAHKAGCRPGYVVLESPKVNQPSPNPHCGAFIHKDGRVLVSSDIFREKIIECFLAKQSTSQGPCRTIKEFLPGMDTDFTISFACMSWPDDAHEWVTRNRQYGWPTSYLINKIVEEGCHLVPVGDKCSKAYSFQWRISFATAERKLVHSLTHLQFKVYGLLKSFLKKIRNTIKASIGEEDIICSYFLKTVVFFAVENSPLSLWQDTNIYVCFRFCLNMLIDWVESAYCPNYFIPTNNMFLRKVNGQNREKLLHILIDHRDRTWKSFSVGNAFGIPIGWISRSAMKGDARHLESVTPCTPNELEMLADFEICRNMFTNMCCNLGGKLKNIHIPGVLLSKSQSDIDEILCYCSLVTEITRSAIRIYCKQSEIANNKQRFNALRKCKRLLTPIAALGTSPGELLLATLLYNTGNYRQALDLCGQMTSSPKIFVDEYASHEERVRYQKHYCGLNHTFYYKCKPALVSSVSVCKEHVMFYPSEIRSEVLRFSDIVPIPPLPYAIFLSFLCYIKLGDFEKCYGELEHLHLVCMHDERQGGDQYWFVHNITGICYQIAGDKHSAITVYKNSLRVMPAQNNMAGERIKELQGN